MSVEMPRPSTIRAPKTGGRQTDGGSSFEECEHIVHDDDVDTALCGVDQTDVPWNQGLPVCEACAAIAQGRMS
jgi:hypothetical protein